MNKILISRIVTLALVLFVLSACGGEYLECNDDSDEAYDGTSMVTVGLTEDALEILIVVDGCCVANDYGNFVVNITQVAP